MSIADILATLYGGDIINFNPKNPHDEERDRFILSKGHAGAAIYACLAECGFMSREILKTHYQDGSLLSGHVSHKGIAGVELSTGSLGHGLGVGAGMAKALKLKGGESKVFVLLSDGECDEGTVWEAALFANHHRLDNLVAIIDYNKIQSLGSISETLDLEPLKHKWESFNWATKEIDGHDHESLLGCFRKLPFETEKPTIIIANTVKGKGVSFMENTILWHYRTPQGKEFDEALKEIEEHFEGSIHKDPL